VRANSAKEISARFEGKLPFQFRLPDSQEATGQQQMPCDGDRDISQDPKIRLQSRRIKITDCGTIGKPDLFLLDSRLADLLDDDDQPFLT
jgi:hypothetical protein